MPTDTVDNSPQPIQITEEMSIKSSSSSSMSNKSSLSSASTSLKGDNVSLLEGTNRLRQFYLVFSNIILDSYVSLQIAFKFEPQRSSCIGVQNQGRRQHKPRKSRRYDFSLENIDVVQEEPTNGNIEYNTNVVDAEI